MCCFVILIKKGIIPLPLISGVNIEILRNHMEEGRDIILTFVYTPILKMNRVKIH